MEKQNIIELDLDELHISKENPRTKIVIDEIQAIHEIIYEQGDKIIGLLKSIIEDGWIVNDMPAIYFENDEYVVYEGNRRISALKCFFNPKLLPIKNKTADRLKKYRNEFSKEEIDELRKKFKKIPVTLHKSKDLLYKYMEKRHTPNNGRGDTLERWSSVANETFKNKVLGQKTMFFSIYDEFKDLFKFIDMDEFPKTTLERILSNPYTKAKLKFSFNNGILLTEEKEKIYEYLQEIINDIVQKKVNSRNLSKSDKIKEYIDVITKSNMTSEEKTELCSKKETNNNVSQTEYNGQIEIENTITFEEKVEKERNIEEKQDTIKKQSKIDIPKGLKFAFLETNTINKSNTYNFGMLEIANELKNISKSGDYKKYTIATAMLIRNLLEQSLKYQLRKNNIWSMFVANEKKRNMNNKEPGLESIINYCNGNTNKIFPNNTKMQKTFRCFASNLGTKDYFDMLVHHPETISADYTILENIAKSGLYDIIYEILNG